MRNQATMIAVLLAGLATSIAAFAQLANEQLLEPLPSGFRVAAQSANERMRETEFIPANETVAHWSEMVTTQIMPARSVASTASFLNAIGQRWVSTCPTPQTHIINSGTANGYSVSMMLLKCDHLDSAGGPENTLFRAIQGSDSFYLVQYAFHSELTRASLDKAAKFLGQVNVCDTRSAAHPCPSMHRLDSE